MSPFSLPVFTKVCFSFTLSLWSACLSCSFVFAVRSAPGQDESTLSQTLSLLNSMSSAIYFHSPSFACSFLLASCRACVRALACVQMVRNGDVRRGGFRGRGGGVELLLLRCQYESVQLLGDSGQGSPQTPPPTCASSSGCLSFLLALPASYFQHRITGAWHVTLPLAGSTEMGRCSALLMSVQHCCLIDRSRAACRTWSSPLGTTLAVVLVREIILVKAS